MCDNNKHPYPNGYGDIRPSAILKNITGWIQARDSINFKKRIKGSFINKWVTKSFLRRHAF
jgi:hypothetical protein